MNFLQKRVEVAAVPPIPNIPVIEIIEAESYCKRDLSPEGNIKYRNYRVVGAAGAPALRAYTPSGDVNTTPTKRKLVPRFEEAHTVSPPRLRILELICTDDPGGSELAQIVTPARRGPNTPRAPSRAAAEDGARFLQRALLSPSPSGCSIVSSDEGGRSPTPEAEDAPRSWSSRRSASHDEELLGVTPEPEWARPASVGAGGPRCLLDELRLVDSAPASGRSCGGRAAVRGLVQRGMIARAEDSDRLGRLARAIETDDCGGHGEAAAALAAARVLALRLRSLLDESRDLRDNVAEIHDDVQTASMRASTASFTARALVHEAHALAFLDDVLVLLRAEPTRARAVAARRGWPFAPDPAPARPHRNYVV